MGKFLVKLGKSITNIWNKCTWGWNKLVCKLMINKKKCKHENCCCS